MSLEHLDIIITPHEATRRLRMFGISFQGISILATESADASSHEMKALAKIAIGKTPENLKQVYISERLRDL